MAVKHVSNTMADMYKQAQSHIPETISLPSTWPSMYEDFVTKNASAVSQIESALRSLTYIIPGEQALPPPYLPLTPVNPLLTPAPNSLRPLPRIRTRLRIMYDCRPSFPRASTYHTPKQYTPASNSSPSTTTPSSPAPSPASPPPSRARTPPRTTATRSSGPPNPPSTSASRSSSR